MKSKKQFSLSHSNEEQGHLRKLLLSSLAKLNSPSTLQTAHNEIRSLISQFNDNQIQILITLLQDPQDLQKQAKKEYIKVFAILAEMKRESIVEYTQKILQVLNKRICEGDSSLHNVIADTIGRLNECSIQKSNSVITYLGPVLSLLQNNFHHNNREAQQVSAMALTKIIQTCSYGVLKDIMVTYTQKTLELLRSSTCRTQSGLLESLMSLLLTMEGEFEPLCQETIISIYQCLECDEWTARKIAIDLLYTMIVVLPQQLREQAEQILLKLDEMRKDRVKPVREAAQFTILAIKDLISGKIENNNKHPLNLKRSIFNTSKNELFFIKAPHNDIEIRENLPRNESPNSQNISNHSTPVKIQYPLNTPSSTIKYNSSVKQLTPEQLMQDQESLLQMSSRDRNIQEIIDRKLNALEQRLEIQIRDENYRLQQRIHSLERLVAELQANQQEQRPITVETNRLKYNQQDMNQNVQSFRNPAKITPVYEDSFNGNQPLLQHEFLDLKSLSFDTPQFDPSSMESNIKQKIDQTIHVQDQNYIFQKEQNYKEVYSIVLTQLDDELLLQTMLRTGTSINQYFVQLGTCCKDLDIIQIEFLLNKLKYYLNKKQNVSLSIKWIYDALLHWKPQISPMLLKKLQETLGIYVNFEGVNKIFQLLNR